MANIDKLTMLEKMVREGEEPLDSDLLSVYLDIAADKLLKHLYPYGSAKSKVPERYAVTQVRIAAYLWSKRGAEGQSAHSENGVSRTYEDTDIPASLLRDIVPYAGVL